MAVVFTFGLNGYSLFAKGVRTPGWPKKLAVCCCRSQGMGTIKEELVILFRNLSTATTLALSIVFSLFAGVITGYYLDTWVFEKKTYPWFTIVCFFFGLGGGAKNFFLLSKRFEEEGKGKKEEKRDPRGT